MVNAQEELDNDKPDKAIDHYSKAWGHAPTDPIWQLTSTEGSTVVEHLEALDEAAKSLSYTLLTDTPFRNCLTTVTLGDLGRGRCQVRWSATFEADGLPANEAAALMACALSGNCVGRKQLLEC